MNELYLKILAAVAPAIILAIIMVRRDRRPEPAGWLLAAVGLGILCGPAVLIIGHFLPDIPTDSFTGAFLNAFVNAAIPEETLKFAALCLIANKCRHFDEVFDGLVYAVCIGMGFAGLENVLYVCGDDNWIYLSISRALLAVPAHYFFAVIMGAFFSLGWFDMKNRTLYLSAALVLPIVAHGLYDTLCFTMGLGETFSGLVLIVFLIGFRWLRRYARRLTTSMLKLDGYETSE